MLDHVYVEDLDCGEHGVDERAVALAAGRSSVAGQREGEGPQFVAGVVEQGFGVGPGLAEGASGSVTALPGGGCLNAHVGGGGFELADQPVDAGGGPSFAGAGTVAAQWISPARRSAVIFIGATAAGTRKAP